MLLIGTILTAIRFTSAPERRSKTLPKYKTLPEYKTLPQ
jgi:hypothetical protein